MKNLKFAFGTLLAAFAILLPGKPVSAAEAETSYSYDTIEYVPSGQKIETAAADLPGTDLDETITIMLNPAALLDKTADMIYSYDTIEYVPSGQKIETAAAGLPGTDLDETSTIYFTIPQESEPRFYTTSADAQNVSKQYDADVVIGSSTIVRVNQTTHWTYTPGVSSVLTGHNVLYQNVKAGYAIESGGSIKTTNNDGTQQIADYFRIFAPDGTYSNWYRILTICSVNGVVSTSLTVLDY